MKFYFPVCANTLFMVSEYPRNTTELTLRMVQEKDNAQCGDRMETTVATLHLKVVVSKYVLATQQVSRIDINTFERFSNAGNKESPDDD